MPGTELALIDPLVPPDLDCRRMPYMPLEVARVKDSDLAALSTGEEFKAAVLLWCASWTQVPAASLPDEDRILARLTGLSMAVWKDVREVALRGWVKCSDGRLYHPLIADHAIKASAKSAGQAARANSRWAKARSGKEPEANNNLMKTTKRSVPRHNAGITEAHAPAMQGEGEGEEKEKEPSVPKSSTRGSRLSPTWIPDAFDRAEALNAGFSEQAVEKIARRFRDYWLGAAGVKGVKADWKATWRNWVDREAESLPQKADPQKGWSPF